MEQEDKSKSFDGLNRTFMELKHYCIIDNGEIVKVLIAPLWNWNLEKTITIAARAPS